MGVFIGEWSGGVGMRVGVELLKSCCIMSAEEEGCSDLVCDLVLQGLCMHERDRRPNLSFQSGNTVKSKKGCGGTLTVSFINGQKSSERG